MRATSKITPALPSGLVVDASVSAAWLLPDEAKYLELTTRRSLPIATQAAAMRKAMKASSIALAEI